MRIAICLSGQPRTWRATRDSLMAFFAGHQLDLFLHTWREGDPAELEALVEAYAPCAVQIEDRPLFVEEQRELTRRFPDGPPLFIFDMFYAVSRSLSLAEDSGQAYDLVVRARFDALFDGVWSGEAPARGALIIPDLFPSATGCTDQFALGSPADMAAYAGVSDWLRAGSYPSAAVPWLQPEQTLRHYLEKVRGLKVEIRPIATKLLRERQVGRPFAQVVEDPLFHAAKHEAWEALAAERFPDEAAAANFEHIGRTALELERGLESWLEAHPQDDAFQLLRAPWPRRILTIDAFLSDQTGDMPSLDEAAYQGIRLMCAMLLQHMDGPMTLESFVVHALSANGADMGRARDWVSEDADRLEGLQGLVASLGPLARALTFTNPLEQPPVGAWRPR